MSSCSAAREPDQSPPARRGQWERFLFPEPGRGFPGRRWVKMALRALHVLMAGLLVGAFVFEAGAEAQRQWLHATIGSGVLLLLLDLHESAAFLCQVRGAFVLAKVAGVFLLPMVAGREALLLGALLAASVILSHAPAKVRYALLFGRGRIRGADTAG